MNYESLIKKNIKNMNKRVDNDDELYNSFFEEPPILPSSKLNEITEERINEFFEKIIKRVKTKNE